MCLHEYTCTRVCRCPQRPEKGTWSCSYGCLWTAPCGCCHASSGSQVLVIEQQEILTTEPSPQPHYRFPRGKWSDKCDVFKLLIKSRHWDTCIRKTLCRLPFQLSWQQLENKTHKTDCGPPRMVWVKRFVNHCRLFERKNPLSFRYLNFSWRISRIGMLLCLMWTFYHFPICINVIVHLKTFKQLFNY